MACRGVSSTYTHMCRSFPGIICSIKGLSPPSSPFLSLSSRRGVWQQLPSADSAGLLSVYPVAFMYNVYFDWGEMSVLRCGALHPASPLSTGRVVDFHVLYVRGSIILSMGALQG